MHVEVIGLIGAAMELTYFGADLSRELGGALPCYCAYPQPHWVSFQDLKMALDNGEAVSIRPATFAEYLRAEQYVVAAKIATEEGAA
jgi:hypothetical protein